MSRPTGPCTLCGAKSTSSGWRRLPECAGELAGRDGCNACYVCLAKASDKCGEEEIQHILAERSALRGVAGPARRKRVYSRRAAGSASASLRSAAEQLPCSFTELLLGRSGPAAGTRPSPGRARSGRPGGGAPTPAGSPAQQRASKGDSSAGGTPSSGSSSSAVHRQLAAGMLSPEQAKRRHLPVASPAASSAPPGTGVCVPPAVARVLNEWTALKDACMDLAGDERQAAETAWSNARQLVGPNCLLAGVLPKLELLMPGAGRMPEPAGVLLVCAGVVLPGQAASSQQALLSGERQALRLVVYCPKTAQLAQCRDRVQASERCLYRHPRLDKWAWDSSEGWKLLFLDENAEGPQIRLFSSALMWFNPMGEAAAPSPQAAQVLKAFTLPQPQPHEQQQQQQQQQQPVPAQMLPPAAPLPPMHPLVPPPQQPGAVWPGQQQAIDLQGGLAAPLMSAVTAQPPSGSQWPGSPQAVAVPSSGLMQQLYAPVPQPSMASPAAQQVAPAASHAAPASAPWQENSQAAGVQQVLAHMVPQQFQQQLAIQQGPIQLAPMPLQQAPMLPPPPQMAWPQLPQLPLLPPGVPQPASHAAAPHLCGPINPGHSLLPPAPAQQPAEAQQAQQALDNRLDALLVDDFQMLLDSLWGDQMGAEQGGQSGSGTP